MNTLMIPNRINRLRSLSPRACCLCLLWSLSAIASAQGADTLGEDAPPNLDNINLMEATNRINAPNSAIVLQRDYRGCLQSAQRTAQRSGNDVDLTTTCNEEKQALKQHLPPDLQAKADAIERDNNARITAQRQAFADAAARDRASAKNEQDQPRGHKVEERHLAKLSSCYAQSSDTKAFDASQCPELLGLDEQDMQRINSYLAELTAIRSR